MSPPPLLWEYFWDSNREYCNGKHMCACHFCLLSCPSWEDDIAVRMWRIDSVVDSSAREANRPLSRRYSVQPPQSGTERRWGNRTSESQSDATRFMYILMLQFFLKK